MVFLGFLFVFMVFIVFGWFPFFLRYFHGISWFLDGFHGFFLIKCV